MEVVVEFIDDTICRLRYKDISVSFMRENGYVNATSLCGYNNKDFLHWLHSDTAQQVINYLETTDTKGSILETTSDGVYIEYYVHRDLVQFVSSWISPSVAVKVHRIMDWYLQECYVLDNERAATDFIKELMKELEEADL